MYCNVTAHLVGTALFGEHRKSFEVPQIVANFSQFAFSNDAGL